MMAMLGGCGDGYELPYASKSAVISAVGTFETFRDVRYSTAIRGKADIARTSRFGSV